MTRVWIPGEDEVLQCLYRLGPSSAREIALELKGEAVTGAEISHVSSRLTTLHRSHKAVRRWKNITKTREDGTPYKSTLRVYAIPEGSQ